MNHETELAISPARERLWFWGTFFIALALAYPALFGLLTPEGGWSNEPGALMWRYVATSAHSLGEICKIAAHPNTENASRFLREQTDVLLRWLLVALASLTPALHLRMWARLTAGRTYKARIIGGLTYFEGRAAVRELRAKLNAPWRKPDASLWLAPEVPLPRQLENRTFFAIGLPGGGKSTFINNMALQVWRRGDKIIMHDTDGDVVASWPGKFWLLNPLNPHSHALDIAADTRGEIAARETMARFIPTSGKDEAHWARGAQEIGVGVLRTLEATYGAFWGFGEWRDANELPPIQFREFASRCHPPAGAFLALEGEEFTKTAMSYVTTYTAAMNTIVRPLADHWGDIDHAHRISLRKWLKDENAKIGTLVLQRAADKPAISEAWLPVVIGIISGFCASSHLPSSKTRRIWAILDEFPQLGYLDRFTQLAEVGRKKGLCCIIAAQNLSQIEDRYGKSGANNIIDLAAFKFIFRLETGPTLEAVCSQLIPPSRFCYQSTDENSGEKIVTQPVIDAAEISRLELAEDLGIEGILIHGGSVFRLIWPFPTMPVQRSAGDSST